MHESFCHFNPISDSKFELLKNMYEICPILILFKRSPRQDLKNIKIFKIGHSAQKILLIQNIENEIGYARPVDKIACN